MENIKNKIFGILNDANIDFFTMEHPAIMTVNEGVKIANSLDVPASKCLLLCDRHKHYYLLMALGEKRLDMKALAVELRCTRLSFASEEDMIKLIGAFPGAVSVMGLANDIDNNVTFILDNEIMECEYVCCHPCVNTCSIKLKTLDLLNKFLPFIHHGYTILK